jgi:hypothetical protein
LEHAIFIAKAVTPERKFLRSTGVEVARGKTSEASVAECGISFGVNQVLDVLIKQQLIVEHSRIYEVIRTNPSLLMLSEYSLLVPRFKSALSRVRPTEKKLALSELLLSRA